MAVRVAERGVYRMTTFCVFYKSEDEGYYCLHRLHLTSQLREVKKLSGQLSES